MEYWSDGPKPNTPMLLYSNTPFRSSASDVLLTSRKNGVFHNLLEDL